MRENNSNLSNRCMHGKGVTLGPSTREKRLCNRALIDIYLTAYRLTFDLFCSEKRSGFVKASKRAELE